MEPVRFLSRALLFFCGFHWIAVEGEPKRNVPIVVANHPSIFEPFWMAYAYLPIAVSKEENARLPFLGTIMKAFSCILVDRQQAASRRKAADEIRKMASNPQLPAVLVFPEGTNSNGRHLLSFKPGAFLPGQEVQPVCVSYPYTFHDVTAGSYTSMFWHLYRTLCQFHNKMTVRCLPPRFPSERQVANPTLFAASVKRDMAEALNVRKTEHSFEDVLLRRHAVEMGQPPWTGLVEFGRLRKLRNDGPSLTVDGMKTVYNTLVNAGSAHEFKDAMYGFKSVEQ